MKIVIASRNVHKILEMRTILKATFPTIDLFSLIDFPNYSPPKEEGNSFQENGEKKALHAAAHLTAFAIGDDSGLVLPALGGAPGIYSARYAGEKATDKDNRKKLVEELKKLQEEERGGYFECALALASPTGLLKSVYGRCEGTLLTEERGGQGFGYDPLFVKNDYNKTFAELEEDTKNRISHRRKALDKLLPALESIL